MADYELYEMDAPKRKRPPAVDILSFTVSRNSGLHSEHTTFGCGNRFGQKKVIGRGRDSPNGREFYSHSPLQKLKWEVGPQCTQGIGGRKGIHDTSVPSKVGPGSYNIVASAAKSNSPLDGPEYCKTSLGRKLPSTLLPVDMCSPGPHHTYEVRKPLDAEQQNFNKPWMSHGSRHPIAEDRDGPGLAYNHSNAKGMQRSSPTGFAGGTKRCVKCTFGMADRFRAARQTSSPVGDMYYAHSKLMGAEDYMSGNRTCTFGSGNKTDFANIYKSHPSDVSPVTYRPVASTAKKTSAFDGLVDRLASPTMTFARRSPSSPSKSMARTFSAPR
mmetsp:Transcript_18523/g.43533  ORF Transcript_18523/g.43533 Transcript_18523/m.43533 type:complete len:328 (+) Transcript_18523:77-1060(+)